MKKAILIIILILPLASFSQGFDWQLTSRHPYEITNKYIGAVAGLSFGKQIGNFPFLERDIVCCNYQGGTGLGVQFGLGGEFWYQYDLAFSGSLTYSVINAKFSTETTVIRKTSPDLPGFNWTTAYNSNISLSYVTLDLAIKKRIYNKLNLKAGLDFNINIRSTESHENVVVEPQNVPFADGTFVKELSNGRIGKLTPFVVGINLGMSYDINLGIERYGELSALGGYSLNSYLVDNSWHNLQAKLILKAFMGIR